MIEDRSPEARSSLHQGTGSRTIHLAEPHPTGQVIIDCTRLSPAGRRIPKLTLHAGNDTELKFAGSIVKGRGDTRCRFLIRELDLGAVTTRIQVECAADCAWRLRVLPLSAARVLDTWATGTGSDVLVYDGPPAVLKLRQTKGRGTRVAVYAIRANRLQALLSTWAPRLVSGGHVIALPPKPSTVPGEAAGVPPEPVSPKPTLLKVAGYGCGWELSVSTPNELRSFSREISGKGREVVRYIGPPGTLRIDNRSWRPGHDLYVESFAEDLSHKVDILHLHPRGGSLSRFRSQRLDLLPGMLVAIGTVYSDPWRIRADN
ncbi:hypothetical protein [Streptomyces sp. NPDC058694]|uniref:hypothetical protein n=1 Tax=Streptomyces sp. NPDC058694 TaxID=3346603 RepID=UPI0036552181